jgi:hypothetical protein
LLPAIYNNIYQYSVIPAWTTAKEKSLFALTLAFVLEDGVADSPENEPARCFLTLSPLKLDCITPEIAPISETSLF